ncbi:LysR family transcriptional regulator [Rhizobium tumorigenes]|uniref:LysR family transcriptional regulator n=1 Tax=Rhizobium tumorigenes TaxID=2041385 RepID=UPI00241F1192|nr:LysR family transcriptional regulator [Rhizobium tumorigenes]WFS04286.1 LysR family transcriptional regulator [Rhizobium tumorigenes]
MERPTLTDLEAFRMVAMHRSFKRAADEIGVSRSSLSHTLIKLEAKLGVRLLNRTTRSVSPTDAGLQLLDSLAPVLRDLEKALDGIADVRGAPRGNLRINANKGAAQWLLRNVVPAFIARYPAVTLDLVSEGRLVDIVAQGFDAGVRLAEAVPQDMIAVPLNKHARFVAVASPAYLAEHGAPATPDDLMSHTCIRQRLPSGARYRWEFSLNGEELSIDPPGALTLDDNALMIDCAARGLGIAFVPKYLAQQQLDARDLLILLDAWSPKIPGNVLYYPGYRHVPSALRAFIGIVREAQREVNR